MDLFRLIGEAAPTVRPTDLLTDDHPLRPYPPLSTARSSAWLRLLGFIGVFVVAVLLLISVVVAATGTIASITVTAQQVIMMIAAITGYVVLTVAMEARGWPPELAWRRWPGLVKGCLVAIIAIGVSLGILALMGSYRITGVDSSYSPWTALLTIGLCAAVTEELLFRGVLFRLAEEGLGTWGAVAVSAVAFGAGHLTNPGASIWGAAAVAVEAGVLFAGIYVLTRSLWWCIGFHLMWNVLEGPVFGSVVSGTGQASSWFHASWSGPQILTGGIFGLEASIVPVLLLGATGVAALMIAHRRGLIIRPIWSRKAILTGLPPRQ